MRYTLVFEWPDGSEPRIGADSEFLGGRCCKVQFSDALEEIERLEDEIEGLRAELRAQR